SQYTDDLESQQHSQVRQDSGVSEKGRTLVPLQRPTRPPYPSVGVESLSYSSTASAPIQAPTFPSPTPRPPKLHSNRSSFSADEQTPSEKDTTKSHRFPRQKSSQPATLPSIPSAALVASPPSKRYQYTSAMDHQQRAKLSENGIQAGDFYIDMLDFVEDTEEHSSQPKQPGSTDTSSSAPTAASHSSISTPSSSPSQTPTRRRSLVDSPRTSNVGTTSPRTSKEARRFIQNFPPPPPPPSIPPPAIPEDASSEIQGIRISRSRALTAPSTGKGTQVYIWGSAPPSPTLKIRRPGFSPTSSTKNLIILPPSSPPPAYISVQQSRELHHNFYHQRTQSSVLASSAFVETLNQFCEPLPLPSSVSSRSGGTQMQSLPIILHSPQKNMPSRPILRHHHSHHGTVKTNDSEKNSAAATPPRMESTPLSDLSAQIMQTIQALREAEDAPGRNS
ncbi:hypothetical protein BGZ65_011456, partial [Modicella reniformis]